MIEDIIELCIFAGLVTIVLSIVAILIESLKIDISIDNGEDWNE